MSTITPVWTDEVSVIAASEVAAGNTQADVAALGASAGGAAKFASRLMLQVGRVAVTAITGNPFQFHIRPMTTSPITHPTDTLSRVGGSTAAVDTNVDGDSTGTTLNVDDTTGFAIGDKIMIVSATGVDRLEFHTVAKITNPGEDGELILVESLEQEHTAVQGDLVTSQADLWTILLPGGTDWDVIGDYGGASAGPGVIVRAFEQTYDSQSAT